MKKVTIEGREYEVPDNAEDVAMDEDGDWWWYANKAQEGDQRRWYADGECGFITSSEQWRSTLRKI